MDNFWKEYIEKLVRLQTTRTIDFCTGDDFWFGNIHGDEPGERISNLLGMERDVLPVDISLCGESLTSVCPRSDNQFHWMVDPLDAAYRRAIIISIGGIPLWILKWFFWSEQNIHICSLSSFSHRSRYWFFGWLYTPNQESVRIISTIIKDQKLLTEQALSEKKWPSIEAPSYMKLFPRRFLKWGRSWEVMSNFYNHLYRESQLIRNAWEENTIIIPS